jgi:hypothetical protein
MWTKKFRAVVLHNAPPAYAKIWNEPILPGPKTGLARLAGSRKVFHLTDLTAEDATPSATLCVSRPVELAGARTFLGVPMLKEDELVGPMRQRHVDRRGHLEHDEQPVSATPRTPTGRALPPELVARSKD